MRLNSGAAGRAIDTLSKITPKSGQRRPTAEQARRLAEAAEAITGVPAARVLGRGRPADVALIRQIIMFLLRESCRTTWMEAAGVLGRDHGTAMHAHRKVVAMLKHEKAGSRQPTADLIRQLCEAVAMTLPECVEAATPGL